MKEIKKIVISSNTSWSIYNFRLNLARILKDKGYKVIIVAPYDKYAEKLKKEFEYHNIFINNKGTNPIEDIRTTLEFYKLYKKIKPDIVFHYTIKPNIYGSIAAKLNNVPSITVVTGLGYIFIKEKRILTTLVKNMYRIAFNGVEKVFFLNNDDSNIFVAQKIVKKEKIFVLPGEGIDTIKFAPIDIGKRDGKFRFLLIARMLWDKGIGEYVEAARIIKQKYSNVEFQLLGFLGVSNRSAISKEQMQEWIDEGLVNYLGVSDDVRVYIAKADCIVLPSYREGIPRTLLEAASMAKPIITTDSVGCRDVVDDGANGFLCKVKNAQDLADKMEKMLNLSDTERKAMGEAGRAKIIKEFDERIVINKYLETIESILDKN